MNKIENFLGNISDGPTIESLAEINGLTTEEFRQFLLKVNDGTNYIRFDSMPWWRRRYYAIVPETPFTRRRTLRRWTRFGILFAMHKEQERSRYFARAVEIDDTEWSDW